MNYLDKNGLSYFWEKIKSALSKKQDKLTAGANITIENNVISAAGGGTGGTSDYDSLTNRPKINNVTLTGNKTLDDLGIQDTLESGTNIKTINNESILGSGNIDIASMFTPVEVSITFEDNNYSGGCVYYPVLRLCYIRLYITGKAFATGSRHIVANIPDGYRPISRVALPIDGLQDYSGSMKASIDSSGDISFITGAAKESADDIYIAGVWFVA